MNTFARHQHQVVSELATVLGRVDEREVSGLAHEVLLAKRIVVIGVGREGLAARGFAMRLMHADLDAHWAWADTAPAICAGDVLVVVSGSGEIGHIEYVCSQARTAGARTAVVTANRSGVTATAADAVLVVPAGAYRATGDLIPSIQPMGSLFEQSVQVVLDLTVLEIMNRRNLTSEDLALNHRNFE